VETKIIREKKLGEVRRTCFLYSFFIYLYIIIYNYIYLYKMAKHKSMKSFQKASSLKKLYVTFASLALLFILSIIVHFVFYKQFREGAENMNDFYIIGFLQIFYNWLCKYFII
jgi:hypothetical protein